MCLASGQISPTLTTHATAHPSAIRSRTGPGSALPTELIDGDRVDLEGELWFVFRRMVTVIGLPREVVVGRAARRTGR